MHVSLGRETERDVDIDVDVHIGIAPGTSANIEICVATELGTQFW